MPKILLTIVSGLSLLSLLFLTDNTCELDNAGEQRAVNLELYGGIPSTVEADIITENAESAVVAGFCLNPRCITPGCTGCDVQ